VLGRTMNQNSTGTTAPGRSGTNTDPVVKIRRMNKHFGEKQCLFDINLDVAAGEVVVVVGPSGSGKSTLCRCVNRLETITTGTIEVTGQPVPAEGRELADLRARAGMVFQSFNLFAHLDVLQNVALAPITVRGLRRPQARARAMDLLARVGMTEHADKYPAQLSGGQQQRVAIARALAMEPRLLLCDEPTSALDPEMVQEVLDVLTGLAAQGLTMLVVTHEMGFARKAADRVVFMDEGRILDMAPPDEFFNDPRSARAADFLAKVLPR